MSKFTKALEKIQKNKEENIRPAKGNGEPDLGITIPSELKEASPYWERGIPTIRNSKPDTKIVTYHFPNSLISEQYRVLRTNLRTQFTKEKAQVILISSAIHGEGKTITAVNLAHSLAEMGDCKVALIDADLRRGKVADYLSLGKDLPGLSTYLTKDISAKEVMVRNSLDNFFIMPRGPIPENPSEVVSSYKFNVLIAELRNHFDCIIVDSPPIMSVADANILGRHVDCVLMVIQARRAPKSVIAHANLLFKQAEVRMLGYILTNVEFQSADYRYYYHYNEKEIEGSKGFKGKVRFILEKMRFSFEKKEEGFNGWWLKKFVKEKKAGKKTEKETQKV